MNKASLFKTLHEQEDILVLGNAWDVLSAMVLEQAGFKAIGTTSWGVSNSLGYTDGEKIAFEELLLLVEKMVTAVSIPVSVDIEAGYGDTPAAIAANVVKLADMGAAGINIEDSFKNADGLRDQGAQADLLAEIRSSLDANGHPDFFINARIDTCFQGRLFEETLERAKAYAAHGASGVFVPGLSDEKQVRQLVETLDVPVNILSLPDLADAAALANCGVKRFSIGNALSDAATAFIETQAAKLLSSLKSGHLYEGPRVRTSFR